MEAILLFCCRSCLKSDKDTLYYDLLGLEDQNASADAIKKAYKKKSLELHPDRLARKGIQVTAEHNQQFQKLKEAYDVLSDPRKRRLYDQIGASGMQLIENPTQMDPMDLIKNFQSNTGDRIKIGIVVALIFCGILVLPILFCLKCDGKLDNSPWLAIWTPMWVVNAVMAISAILFIMEKEQDEYNGEDEDENKEKPEKIPITVKLMFAAKTFAFIFIQIFVLMRMDQEVEWSWFKVFIPWFIYEALSILEKLPTVFSTVPPVDPALAAAATHIDEETGEEATPEIQIVMQETERHRKLLEQATMRSSLVVNFLRIWFALFLAARLDEDNNWDWGVVMLPIWLYFAVELVTGYLFRQWGSKLIEEADIDMEALEAGVETDPIKMMKFQHGSELVAAGSLSCCAMSPLLLMAILLVSRLDTTSFSTFIVIIPVFIAIGCCICGVGCGLLCLSCVDTSEDADEVASDDPTAHMINPETEENPVIVPSGGPSGGVYEPPHVQETEGNNVAAYGTFEADQQNDTQSNEQSAPVVHETTIDVDID